MRPEDTAGSVPADEQQTDPESRPAGETNGSAATPDDPAPLESVQEAYDPYGYPYTGPDVAASTTAVTEAPVAPPPAPPAPPAAEPEAQEEDGDDDGMLRMSFLGHLEELRSRIFKALAGLGVAFLVSVVFAERLWLIVSAPATSALTSLGYKDPRLAQLSPMETFSVVWIKLPMLAAVFLGSPWILYQVWAFIAPGLYKRERRWAAPFVICSAGLFILGGTFAYFVAFRFGLTFLLGIGRDIGILPLVSVSEYFDLFVNVMLGIGLVFELPVLIFFLTLLRVASPRWLISNSRYAILAIVCLAAIITPTPDIFNLMLFSVPMVLLFFVGVFASYLLVLSRENRRFPWGIFLASIGIPLALIAAGVWLAVTRYGFRLVYEWPFLVR